MPGMPEDVERCRALGIRAYLTKPVKQSELLEAILVSLGQMTASGPLSEAPPPVRRLHILLAEDSDINQRLAVRLLEKQGHQVTVAVNGREAVEAVRRGAFDLVLMDVQMPEMDGLTATAHIRGGEKGTGRRLPILAMTACAMKGDKERCLASGMDGYVAKPIQAQELLARIGTIAAGLPAPSGPALPEPSVPEVDREAALAHVGGDTRLLSELVDIFLSSCPTWMNDLSRAVASRDSPTVRRLAHTVKGAVGGFGAGPAHEAAQRLEWMGRSGKPDGLDEAWALLEATIERLKPELIDLKSV
jgi:CheY-like chemotaxis protein/HPt (histidine-containing phosphotransfer) domain-containing protein